jgi:hypothetical protein
MGCSQAAHVAPILPRKIGPCQGFFAKTTKFILLLQSNTWGAKL